MDTNKEKSMDDSYKFIMNDTEKVVEMHVPLKGRRNGFVNSVSR